MKKIRILNIVFDAEIAQFEVPAFRGAIASKTDGDNVLFHNHIGDTFRYAYPLIQYKRLQKRPAIVCIERGVDEIHKYFENKCWDIEVSGRWLKMTIAKLQMNQFTMQAWDRMFPYSIRNWIALNQENYRSFVSLQKEEERTEFLRKTLTANILSFAKGIDWHIDRTVEVRINEVRNVRPTMLKGQKVLGFDVMFATNVFLPHAIGLGKSVSVGFGTVAAI